MNERVENAIKKIKEECGVTHVYEYKDCGSYVEVLSYCGSVVVYRVYNNGEIYIKQERNEKK